MNELLDNNLIHNALRLTRRIRNATTHPLTPDTERLYHLSAADRLIMATAAYVVSAFAQYDNTENEQQLASLINTDSLVYHDYAPIFASARTVGLEVLAYLNLMKLFTHPRIDIKKSLQLNIFNREGIQFQSSELLADNQAIGILAPLSTDYLFMATIAHQAKVINDVVFPEITPIATRPESDLTIIDPKACFDKKNTVITYVYNNISGETSKKVHQAACTYFPQTNIYSPNNHMRIINNPLK